jgi:alkanesulfonate monooxygenase SsuD/methylene tetrahydromethanopterin reductase-like flavin-dependent oxidoreductase (luciferase family)
MSARLPRRVRRPLSWSRAFNGLRGTRLMRLGYFTMPVHPLDRDFTRTLDEDREAIILADQLGFYDAFVGEHLTDTVEPITNSMIFQATLIHATKTIKLATGTTNLSHMHPTLVACHAAMFDHLAKGRFILGISAGALPGDAEVLGILGEDRNKMFAEAIDVILAIWEREPPYDIDFPGNRFKVTSVKNLKPEYGSGLMPKPYQKPRPEIVGTVVAPFSKGVIAMGERDFHPLSANFLQEKWLPSHWANYSEGKAKAGVPADRADWRIARTIFVADDDKVAAEYAMASEKSPYRFYYKHLHRKLAKSGRLGCFKEAREQPDDQVTLDYVLDRLVVHGSVNKVVDHILELNETVGGFGEIVYAGMDWVVPQLAKRSMELMASEVMPRVNAALGRPQAARKTA